MRFSEWINKIIESGLLCEAYTDKVEEAKSKKRLMDIALDSNGLSYLCEMQAKGMALPYETIVTEFKSYINGRYKAEFSKGDRIFYTSCLYCCYDESVDVDTTATVLLGCKCVVNIKDWDFAKLYIDSNCDITIHCPINARCLVEYWGNAKLNIVSPKKDNVTLNKNDE